MNGLHASTERNMTHVCYAANLYCFKNNFTELIVSLSNMNKSDHCLLYYQSNAQEKRNDVQAVKDIG